DDYNTTLQAVACADIVHKGGIPAMVLLSGGTNSRTGKLAAQCGVRANGVAIGTFARKLVKDVIKKDDFYSNMSAIKDAVSMAENLINENLGALND
ncbi:MAG: 4Fe-4S ferredoxin, partial [Candidatus Omnitrophica bacterium]|nr:4Fe-4S ferredoxin [Candidatus Omnitrophota bacterium]